VRPDSCSRTQADSFLPWRAVGGETIVPGVLEAIALRRLTAIPAGGFVFTVLVSPSTSTGCHSGSNGFVRAFCLTGCWALGGFVRAILGATKTMVASFARFLKAGNPACRCSSLPFTRPIACMCVDSHVSKRLDRERMFVCLRPLLLDVPERHWPRNGRGMYR
jgi:hypothetical protein